MSKKKKKVIVGVAATAATAAAGGAYIANVDESKNENDELFALSDNNEPNKTVNNDNVDTESTPSKIKSPGARSNETSIAEKEEIVITIQTQLNELKNTIQNI